MIQLITGVPGSGKTYYCVKRVVEEFPGFTLITNIDGLKLPHLSLNSLIDRAGSSSLFFNLDYQKSLPFTQVVYLIDECQFYFPKKFYDESVFNYFQMHRHFPGHHILLVTQNSNIITPQLVSLCDHEIYFLPLKLSLFGEFSYKTLVPAGGSSRDAPITRIRRDKNIFNYYKSTSLLSNVKVKSLFRGRMLFLFFLFSVGAFLFYRHFYSSSSSPTSPVSIINQSVPKYNLTATSSSNSTTHPALPSVLPVTLPFTFVSYQPLDDTVVIMKDGKKIIYYVRELIDTYPPEQYQYAFLHLRKRFFRVYNKNGTTQLFPNKIDIYISTASTKETTYQPSDASLPVLIPERPFSSSEYNLNKKNLENLNNYYNSTGLLAE